MRTVRYRDVNRYGEFLQAARTISDKISTMDGVAGIMGTGGLGRGYCDRFSDLDLIVYADESHGEGISEVISVGVRHHEIDLDIEVRILEEALANEVPSDYWSQVARWDLETSQILHDPQGEMQELLREKLVFPDVERGELMERHRAVLEEQLKSNFLVWERRGTSHNLAHVIRSAVEHLILWIYAKNREFQPYIPKWLFYHLEGGFVPEHRYLPRIAEVYTLSIGDPDEARDVRESLIHLCEEVGVMWRFEDMEDALESGRRKWEESSELTRYYLGW